MTLDGFLSFIALMIAIYALAPRHKQLEFVYRLFWGDVVVASISFISILYLQYYSFFHYINFTTSFGMTAKGLGTEKVSFLISLFFGLYLMIIFLIRGVSKNNIDKFKKLCEELANQKLFAELVSIIEKRITDIHQIAIKDSYYEKLLGFLKKQSRQKISSYESMLLLHMLAENKKTNSKIIIKSSISGKAKAKVIWSNFINYVINKLPKPENSHKKIAHELVNEILLSEDVIKGLIAVRPYFVITFIEQKFNENKTFIDIALRDFQLNPKSILYKEVKRCRNITSGYSYRISKSNRLINKILVDTDFAVTNQVWRPIGEQVIKQLDEFSKASDDPYNWPKEHFNEDECPIINGIHFFDIMVREALVRDVDWHMWLYYFSHFLDGIIKNMENGSREIDRGAEFPSRYHYLVYELFATVEKWIEDIEKVSNGNKNLILKKENAEHENGNIIKSAIIVLGICLKKVLESDKFEQRFKNYIASGCFYSYFELLKMGNYKSYAASLSVSIAQGGHSSFTKAQNYKPNLRIAFDDFDRIPYPVDQVKKFEKILFDIDDRF